MYVFFYFSTIIQMILSASFLQNVVIFPHFVTSQGAVFTYIMQKKKKKHAPNTNTGCKFQILGLKLTTSNSKV